MEKTFKPQSIKFSELNNYQQQEFANYLYHGLVRHQGDIKQIESDLEHIKWKYGIVPKDVIMDWIEVTE